MIRFVSGQARKSVVMTELSESVLFKEKLQADEVSLSVLWIFYNGRGLQTLDQVLSVSNVKKVEDVLKIIEEFYSKGYKDFYIYGDMSEVVKEEFLEFYYTFDHIVNLTVSIQTKSENIIIEEIR